VKSQKFFHKELKAEENEKKKLQKIWKTETINNFLERNWKLIQV